MSIKFEEHEGGLAHVRLARPEKRNALTGEMLARLGEIFADVQRRRDLRVVVLSGEGRDFCAGTDMAELAALGAEGARLMAAQGRAVCDAIESYGVPVIAAVQGAASGGGCELALACHLRVVASDVRFGLPEPRLGVIAASGATHRHPRAAGDSCSLAAMLAGGGVSADEALRLGLAGRVAAPAQVLTEAEALARAIINTAAPLAVRACLEAVTRGARLSLAEGLELETELFSRLFSTEDAREGISAFLEKRKPAFKGR